ncbi:amidohydrolase [Streptomyces sp. NBC_01317]|uniref:amidohydrolase n=1 Tax=Streptomyces sp. NBC_01317 TaxID=2903822 RepID=UPI002E1643F3|nr:amidohydrolase [Streptomyces sp. NBC_01317]
MSRVAYPGENVPVLNGLAELVRPALALYLDLHRHPELSGEERRTAAALAHWLRDAGYEVTEGVGGHGVVGVLRNGEGPRVLIRAELDALPVEERTGLPYTSQGPVMHACGHDLHIAAAAGAASLLARARESWRGTVVVVGQPAEETLAGARAVLRDGLYERFGRPDAVLAQHTAPLLGGMVAHGYGPMLAGSVTFEAVVHGRGGHAGTPHLAVDPLLTAAAAVLRLQGTVSRESAPTEQVTLNVGSFHSGTGSNLVPDRATLGITVRALSERALDRMTAAVERVVRAECAASGCPRDPEITVVSRSPVTHPDPAATGAVRRAHEELYGPRRVGLWPPAMATEDFPLYGDAGLPLHGMAGIPLSYWMLGVVGPKTWAGTPGSPEERLAAQPPNHSPEFAPDARTALPTGITAMASAALNWLGTAPRAAAGASLPGDQGISRRTVSD